ncbi:MAG: carbohydrate binding family 9 domain-containing protein [Chitinophagales bacterium]|nr:carbohydrate binding family 9 domain-containing protein [Chitinophagales bacterium]
MKLKIFCSLLILNVTVHKTAYCQQQPYHPLRITNAITLDGKLDDPAWNRADVENDFMQTDPNPGADPSEKTEMRILYNDEYMYVGFRCYESEPDKIIRLGLERDFSLGSDDGTSFLIDTYHDKSSAVVFATNTLDARWDTQISNDALTENDSYNTFWDVASHIDSLGYTTVYRIPFSSLRFESASIVTMGFRVARYVKRKSELTTFPKLDPKTQNGWINVSYARDMVLYNLKSRKPFYITPYIIANYSEENQLNETGTGYTKNSELITQKNFVDNKAFDKILSNIGVDVKYGLSKNFTLDLSLNTDFAQAEVDDRIINLSRFEVNLPEKRSFFLESAHYLSYGFPSGNELFISRTIGNENGVIVPIIAGARVTGKSNGWQIGMLDMQTKGIGAEAVAPHNFFVFRTRKDIDSLGSFIGGIFTNRINTDSSHLSNQIIGLDFVKRLNQQLAIEGGIASTLINFNFHPRTDIYYQAGIFKNVNEGFNFAAYFDVVGKNFYPVTGYLDENNYASFTGNLGYQYTAKPQSLAEYWYINMHNSYRLKLSSGSREILSTNIFPGITFKNGADINFSLFEYTIDSLSYNWFLNDRNAIAAGVYKMFNNTINLSSPQQSKYNADVTMTYGGFYGGKRFYFSPNIRYSFNKHFNVGITYEYNHILFKKYLYDAVHTTFESNLVRLNIAYLISIKFSLKVYTQYDDLSHSLSSNLRFRYNPEEGTDLFLVINQGLNTARNRLDPHLPIVNSQAITIKFLKTFGI